jgi:uncharacterized membrane protein
MIKQIIGLATRARGELILKVVIWRVLSILITLVTLYAITGDTQETTWITLLLHTLFTIGHYTFELAWGRFFKPK